MSNEVVLLKITNLEQTSERHERLIEQLVESQIDMKTGLTKVATELEITNGLIGSYMANMQKVVLALIAIVAGGYGPHSNVNDKTLNIRRCYY